MSPRYTDEFKIETARQVGINEHSIKEPAERLGAHPEFLRNWIKQFESPKTIEKSKEKDSTDTEIKRLYNELKRIAVEQIAIILTIFFKRYTNHPLWLVGFGLLILVVLKLFFVELKTSGTVERIISIIMAGSLLHVRYFMPLSPNKDEKS